MGSCFLFHSTPSSCHFYHLFKSPSIRLPVRTRYSLELSFLRIDHLCEGRVVCFDRVCSLDDVAWYADDCQERNHDRHPECGPLQLIPAVERELLPRSGSLIE
jgi:hypothetical protein